jgi:hypothetical protein
MPRPLCLRKRNPVPIVQEAGWVPDPVSTGTENLSSTGLESPGRPTRREFLYRLSYRGPRKKKWMFVGLYFCVVTQYILVHCHWHIARLLNLSLEQKIYKYLPANTVYIHIWLNFDTRHNDSLTLTHFIYSFWHFIYYKQYLGILKPTTYKKHSNIKPTVRLENMKSLHRFTPKRVPRLTPTHRLLFIPIF